MGDMRNFRFRRKFDAAFNLINSFRHLTTGRGAVSHLRCVAGALRRNGIYVLGLHLTPTSRVPASKEVWEARRGSLSLKSCMWTIDRDLRQRKERLGFSYTVRMPSRQFRVASELVFRTYTVNQFTRMIRNSGVFETTAVYDFGFKGEQKLGPDTEDAVVVLRKRTRYHELP